MERVCYYIKAQAGLECSPGSNRTRSLYAPASLGLGVKACITISAVAKTLLDTFLGSNKQSVMVAVKLTS